VNIEFDRTKCDGFGFCARYARDVFDLDEWGYVSLIGAGSVAPVREDDIRRALLDCPVHAVTELHPASEI
jgi:ferredoxin